MIYAIIQIVVAIVLAIVGFITGLVAGAIGMDWIAWLVGIVLGLVEFVVGVYVVGGIAMSILHFTGVLDKASAAAQEDKKDAE
ncbi:MAG: hypothetical protein IJW44_03660 [Clostridia bacterium]|nr:hypothetical protein [Clostridia bacterium]